MVQPQGPGESQLPTPELQIQAMPQSAGTVITGVWTAMNRHETTASDGDNVIPSAQLDVVVERWQTARIQLAKATQEFSDATSALDREASRVILSPNRARLEANLAELDTTLPGISEDIKRLIEDRMKLGTVRNRSEQLVAISRLPEDVLRDIFAILVGWDHMYCDHGLPPNANRKDVNVPNYAMALSSVCTTWRHIMVNTPSFWSHVDLLIISGHYAPTEYTKLVAQRARNIPIELHIFCNDNADLHAIGQPEETAILPENLRSGTLNSLHLVLFGEESSNHVICAWIHNFSSLTRLAVKRTGGTRPSKLVRSVPDQDLLYSKLFRLHTIDLCHAPINWDRATFSGLCNLKLSSLHRTHCPTPSQLRNMLDACPGLRTLQFSGVELPISKEPVDPVRMTRLTLLGLNQIPSGCVSFLLALVVPGLDFSCLSVQSRPKERDSILNIIEPWSQQFKIRTLSLRMRGVRLQDERLGRFLSSFKHVRTLNLSYLNLCGNGVVDMICPRPGDAHPTLPCLQYLRLHRCCPTPQGLRRILSTHPITWLRMDNCRVHESRPDNALFRAFESFGSEIPDDFRDWLIGTIPELYIDHGFEVVNMSGWEVSVDDKGLPWWIPSFDAP